MTGYISEGRQAPLVAADLTEIGRVASVTVTEKLTETSIIIEDLMSM